MNLTDAKTYIIGKLENESKPELFYHNVAHTMDVYHSCIRIAENEGFGDYECDLLKTAALLHDIGMLKTYNGHEEASVEIAKDILPVYGYTQNEIEIISDMIITTQLPQNAKTYLEQIICDADLDYLGREDFFMISHRLRLEWIMLNIKKTSLKEWYELQVGFLGSHQYYTKTALSTRNFGKMKNLNQIKELLNQ